MSTDQLPQVVTREVAVGTEVICADHAGAFRYEGPAYDDSVSEFGLLGHGGPKPLKCSARKVAPSTVPVPKADDRVTVVKCERGEYPSWSGPWLVSVLGKRVGFHGTKRDATAHGLRVVAIADWHAVGETK